MPSAARKGDSVLGTTTGEHHGHFEPHPPCALNGTIQTGSSNVFINSQPAARNTESVSETDCCGPGTGVLSKGSSTVFINGKPATRIGDDTSPHNGSAKINSGSNNVFIGG